MKRHVSGIILMILAFVGYILCGFAYFLGYIQGSWSFVGWQLILILFTLAGYGRDDQLNNMVILEGLRAENIAKSKANDG